MRVIYFLSFVFLSFLLFSCSEDDNPTGPVTGTSGIEMMPVDGGSFTMGCTLDATNCKTDQLPVHGVTLSGFFISKYEITSEQYASVLPQKTSSVGPTHPVTDVSWYWAITFCNQLSDLEGLQRCYNVGDAYQDGAGNTHYKVTCNFGANGYRLPTEAEWEFAARGGNSSSHTAYSGCTDISNVGWYLANSGGTVHEAGKKQPNEIGLHDMSGNAAEWCWDYFGSYSDARQLDPIGPSQGTKRVVRGGDYHCRALDCCVSSRNSANPALGRIGFRVVRNR